MSISLSQGAMVASWRVTWILTIFMLISTQAYVMPSKIKMMAFQNWNLTDHVIRITYHLHPPELVVIIQSLCERKGQVTRKQGAHAEFQIQINGDNGVYIVGVVDWYFTNIWKKLAKEWLCWGWWPVDGVSTAFGK